MVPRSRILFLLSSLSAVLVATGAMALSEPTFQADRPGPHASQVRTAADPLEATADGFINRTTGAMVSWMNQNAGPFEGGPEAAARNYLKTQAGVFALSVSGDDLILDMVQETPGGWHVRLHQAVNGIPVHNAEIVVSLDETGRFVRSVVSSYDPMLAPNAPATIPVFTADQAEALARAAVWITPETGLMGTPKPPALYILRQEDRTGSSANLAWRVSLPAFDPRGDWEVFIDARDGSVLRVTDLTFFIDGSGNVFEPDPLTTAEVAYGAAGYTDGNDADTPQLTAELVLKTLPEITFEGGLYKLRGPWAEVIEWDPPVVAPYTSATPDGFALTRNPQGFEDVNGYYTIDQSQRYIQSLGFNNIQHGRIQFDTHGFNGADNSAFYPGTNRITYGEGGVDDAEDADVLLHEYGHSLQSSMVPGWGSSTQARSMGEGFGDYWCGSYSKSISNFRQEWVFNWDGHNPFWGGRVLNSTLGYPNLNNDIYHDGTIWASVWWLIHAELGRIVSDTDMLKMHFYLTGGALMQQAAQQAMQADRDLYGGLHAGTLDYYFTLRSFFTAAQYDVPVLTHTPLGEQSTLGPYPVTVTIASTSAITAGTVKVKFGTGTTFDQEAVLAPTGNPNEWGGAIPGQGGNIDIRYYITATNGANWPGTAPRGAEYQFYQFHVTADPAAIADAGAKLELTLSPANPNPFPALTALAFNLPASGDVRMIVHDVSGRTVRTLVDSRMDAGAHASVWDGRDDAGDPVASGLYFVRLSAAGENRAQKVLLTR